jgi:hypothetical protein
MCAVQLVSSAWHRPRMAFSYLLPNYSSERHKGRSSWYTKKLAPACGGGRRPCFTLKRRCVTKPTAHSKNQTKVMRSENPWRRDIDGSAVGASTVLSSGMFVSCWWSLSCAVIVAGRKRYFYNVGCLSHVIQGRFIAGAA